MRQYRLRTAMILVGVIAVSIAVGGYMERARHGASRGVGPRNAVRETNSPTVVGDVAGQYFNHQVGASW